MKTFVYKRQQNYFWEITLVKLTKKIIMFLMDTPITPNMITLFNLCITLPACCFVAWDRNYVLLAMLVQVYAAMDVMDGNLARNKNMTSKFGKILDTISDTLFYTVFFFLLGYRMDTISLILVVCSIMTQQLYGIVATYYIAPKVRGNDCFQRTKLKQFFYDRNILFGMDAQLANLITSVMLIFPFRQYLFVINMCLWLVDLFYRLYEVNSQKRRKIV